jgi:hypothetical protein
MVPRRAGAFAGGFRSSGARRVPSLRCGQRRFVRSESGAGPPWRITPRAQFAVGDAVDAEARRQRPPGVEPVQSRPYLWEAGRAGVCHRLTAIPVTMKVAKNGPHGAGPARACVVVVHTCAPSAVPQPGRCFLPQVRASQTHEYGATVFYGRCVHESVHERPPPSARDAMHATGEASASGPEQTSPAGN